MRNGTMFVDLDWPLNASSQLSASAELLVNTVDAAFMAHCYGTLYKLLRHFPSNVLVVTNANVLQMAEFFTVSQSFREIIDKICHTTYSHFQDFAGLENVTFWFQDFAGSVRTLILIFTALFKSKPDELNCIDYRTDRTPRASRRAAVSHRAAQ